MKIHLLSRGAPTIEHLDAIWSHLPADLQGDRIVDTQARARRHWRPEDVVLVGSYPMIAAARAHRVVYVEHGAGQSYETGNVEARRYYHGGEHPDNVVGYLGPRQDVIDAWGRPGFACGAPVCDRYEIFSPERVAAITFHWNAALPWRVGVPEAGTAFDAYVDHLPRIVQTLRDDGYEVLGHGHPRFNHLKSVWRNLGVQWADVDEVRRRAQLLIADNTSLLFEALYLWRDVIALNAPWFRRDVEHGLRFWSHAPTRQAEDPEHLISMLGHPPIDIDDLKIPEYVYGATHSDGMDGQRAAAWLVAFVGSL